MNATVPLVPYFVLGSMNDAGVWWIPCIGQGAKVCLAPENFMIGLL